MKKSLLFISILLFTISCGNDNKQSFREKYTKSQIVDLVTDVQIFESLISTHRTFNNPAQQSKLFDTILNKHQFTKKEYDSLMSYLNRDIEYYQIILDSAKVKIDSLKSIDLPLLRWIDTTEKKKPPKRKYRKN